jgi:stress-induced morphogen
MVEKGSGSMGMSGGEIQALIRAALPDAEVTVEDLAGDGNHYRAHVVSPAFRGKSRVQQHQMVYQALGGRMGGELHALALTTEAPA